MKCTENHDMPEGAKFCGECGGQAAGKEILKASCGNCQTEQIASHKHCIECGGQMASPEADLSAALGELNAFHKARAEFKDNLEVPAFDQGALDFLKAGDAGAASGGKGEEDDEDDEEVRLFLKALIAGHNHSREHLTVIGNAVQQSRKDMGVFVKAVAAGMQAMANQVASIKKDFEAWKNQRQPRKAGVTPFAKAMPEIEGGPEDESPKIMNLVTVEQSVEFMKAGLLQGNDPTQLQFYAQHGATLEGLSQADPGLANRLVGALRKRTQAAAN